MRPVASPHGSGAAMIHAWRRWGTHTCARVCHAVRQGICFEDDRFQVDLLPEKRCPTQKGKDFKRL